MRCKLRERFKVRILDKEKLSLSLFLSVRARASEQSRATSPRSGIRSVFNQLPFHKHRYRDVDIIRDTFYKTS